MHSNANGGLWFIDKQDRLVFYDGQRLNNATDSNGDVISGVTDMVMAGHLLWLVKDGLAFKYSPGTARLSPVALGSSAVQFVEKIGQDIWYAGGDGLYAVSDSQQQWVFYAYPKGLDLSGLYAAGNSLFVAAPLGAYEFRDRSFQDEPLFTEQKITALFEDNSKKLWVGTRKGLFYSREGLPFVASYGVFSPPEFVTSMTETGLGLWVGTVNGLFLVDLQSQELTHYRAYAHDIFAIDGNYVAALLRDEQGSLWVSTNKGINYLPRISSNFRRLRFGRDTDLLQASQINDVVQLGDGQIWLATDNGLTELSETLEVVRTLPSFGKVNDMAYRDGKLWLATETGLKIYVLATGKWGGRPLPEWFKDEHVISVTVDHYGSVWIGMASHLYRFWPDSEELISFGRHWTQSPSGSEVVTSVFEDSEQQIWVGTDYALYHFEAGRLNLVEESIGQGGVLDIYEDRIAQLWVVNNDSLQQAQNITQFHLKTISMMGSRTTPYCAVAAEGGIWLGSSKGLSHYSFSGQLKQHFSPPFGVLDNEFYSQSCLYLQSGKLLFASRVGLLAVNPDVLQALEHPLSTARISSIQVDQKQRFFTDFREQELAVPFGSAINFQVGRLPFSGLESLQYRLAGGRDESWKRLDGSILVFDALDPGLYQLELRSGFLPMELSSPISYPFQVKRPWYFSYWLLSITAVFLLVLFLCAMLWRSRGYHNQNLQLKEAVFRKTEKIELHKKQLYASNKQLQQILHMRQQFMAQLSNEMRIPLVHTLEPLKRMSASGSKEWGESLNVVSRNVERALYLTEQLLNRDALAFVEPERACEQLVSPLIQACCMSWQMEAEQKGIILCVEDETEGLSVKMAPYHLEIVIGNLLSNALKYTESQGCISVMVKQKQLDLVLSVSDTGKGIAMDARANIFNCYFKEDGDYNLESGFGLGLSTVKQLVECYRGEISVISYQGIGSEFIVTLPLYRESNTTVAVNSGQTDKRDELPCLLVASTDKEVMTCLSALLKGFHLIMARDGYEAVILARENQPDMVLCDLALPGLDGLEVFERLQREPINGSAIFVLFLAEGEHYCVSDHSPILAATIDKPLDADSVLNQIMRFLGKNRPAEFDGIPEHNIAPVPETEVATPWRVNVISLVENHFHDPDFGTSMAAKALFMSERSLQRKFKQEFGMSLKDYIIKFRFQQAKLMLRQGDRISDVALSCGFNEPSYFSACFKRCFGMTPSQYASKYQKIKCQKVKAY
ncbi:helix-turn-helix domain-containing protein [uncultured Photobacterium sp.]|uniref:hybrid sensor histidine kinase/response regulator transcription factor n=1 Tax=uncultured Photobacterium sp. TaxID=173973 RepID=UPI00262B2FA2|nr:helix-turn-helix domain-containing protein [uncultured Photobacterium sp.]